MIPSGAEARVLRALSEGADLAMHSRETGRGPYYTLAGRRLSVVTLKALEGRGWVARAGRGGTYALTEGGRVALEEWEHARPREG